MADRSIVVRLKADVAGFKTAMAEASKSTTDAAKGLEGYVTKNRDHINSLSTQAGLAGLALTGVAVVAVKAFADWDAKMAQVQSLSHATADDMGKLRDASKGFAAEFGISASQAADAELELTKAGVSTSDMVNGALKGALTLASAGQLDVADATSIAASAMTQFNLKGKDVGHVADILAAGADKALGSVSDLGEGLKFVGPVAHSLGVGIESTVGVLSLFAQNGILAEQAGTGLRGVLQALVSPSAQAQKTLDQYGISLFDAQGKFIGLAGLAGQLHDKLNGLTQAQQAAALGTIFGNQQVTTATILMQGGAKAVDQWTSSVDAQGFASEQASGKLDSLNGDLEKLRASFQNDLIETGSGANDTLRSMVQEVTNLVEAFGSLPHGVQTSMLAIVGVGGLVLLGVAGLAKLTTGINDARLALQSMEISGKAAGLAVGGVGLALGVATLAVSHWATAQAQAKARTDEFAGTLDAFGKTTDSTLSKINDDLSKSHKSWLSFLDGTKDTRSASEMADTLGISITDVQGAIIGETAAQERANAALKAGLNFTGQGIAASKEHRLASKTLSEIIDQESASLTEAEKQTARKAAADQAAGVAADGSVAPTKAATAAAQAQADATAQATKAIDDWRKMVSDGDASFLDLQADFDAVIQKNKDVAQTAADSSKSSTDSWNDFYDGTTVSADDYIAQLQAQVDAQGKWEQNMLDITQRVKTGMSGDMADAAHQMIDELLSLGPKGAAQVQLLHDMSDTQFATVVDLYRQKGTDAVSDFVASVQSAQAPTLPTPKITSQADAVSQFLAQQQARLNANPLSVVINAKTGTQLNAVGFNARVNAEGGLQVGPGTGTSDSIPSWLSNGEYVVKASAVQQYGTQFFDNLNAQRYATGGQVGSGSAGSASGSSGPMSIEGTLDLGNGLTGYIKGIARAESVSVLRSSAGRAR